MGKIGSFFKYEQKSILQVVLKYIGSLVIVVILCTFFLIKDIAGSFLQDRNEEYFLLFIIMSLAGVFFTESCFRGIKSRETTITGYILSFIMALLWLILDILRRTGESELADFYYINIAVFYCLILFGLSLITIVRENGLPFEQYFVRMIFSVLRVVLILLVVNLGFLFIFFLIDKLIADIDIGTWIYRLELIFTAFVYVPYILSCLTNRTEEKPSGFARGIVLYALMPLYLASVVIVYIYIIRILIIREFPVNQVFIISAYVFAAGFIIWTMAYAFTRRNPSTVYHIIIRYMKYIVSPLILLELYSMIIRIDAYGWTEARYLSIWFIVLQIIYTAWEPVINLIRIIFHKQQLSYGEHYEWMIYVILAVYFFCFIFPWSSAAFIEDISQESRLTGFIEDIDEMNRLNRDWTPDEYQTVAKLKYEGRSALRVLERNIFGKVYLKSNYREGMLESLLTMPDTPQASVYENDTDDWAYSSFYNNGYPTDHLVVSIESYKTFCVISTHYSYDEILTMEQLKSVRFGYGTNKAIVADISGIISNMVNQTDGRMTDPATLLTLNLSAGQKIIITSISFRYSEKLNQVTNLQLEGYVFLP